MQPFSFPLKALRFAFSLSVQYNKINRNNKNKLHKTNHTNMRKRALHMAKKMTEEAQKARREYYRNWRKNHPGKDREYHNRYWEKKAAQGAKEATA